MMKSGRWSGSLVLAVTIAAATTGCVSLDEHRQLQMAHRTLEGEKAQLEQELYDARNNVDSLRGQYASTQDRLADREALVNNLKSENDRLASAFSDAQLTARSLAQNGVPNDPIIIETKLPAALDTALKDFASQYPDSVEYDAGRGIVKWKSDLVFALGSDVVRDDAKNSLRSFAQIMSSPAASNFEVLVVGHTDDRPVSRPQTKQLHPTNWHLSTHRSIAVSRELQRDGVPPSNIGVVGYGEYRPVASNATEDGRAQNRRVEIFVVPSTNVTGFAATSRDASSMAQADGVK